jgi:Na+-transporting NADH:ubiquinone oxidoreductase subunit C
MHSDRYTILFALLICVTCSVLLALTAGALKPLIQRNENLDIRKNILRVLNLYDGKTPMDADEMETLYMQRVRVFFVDDTGRTVTDPDASPDNSSPVSPVYARIDDTVITGYAIPFSGQGLWGAIQGYLAVEADGETIMGITFHKHNETPGLGGEIDSDGFTGNFIGKKIFDETGNLTSVTVFKGRLPDDMSDKARLHTVDGISGATRTGESVTILLEKNLRRYLPFFKSVREGGTPFSTGV